MRFTAVASSVFALIAVAIAIPTSASAATVSDTWNITGIPGSIAVSPDESTVYVAVNDGADDHILALDAATGTELRRFTGPDWQSYAFGLALSADGTRLYAASENTSTLFVFDTTTGATVGTAATGLVPRDVAVAPDGRVYVASNGSQRLEVFDGASLAATATIPLSGPLPFSVAIANDGLRAYVALDSGTVSVIDLVTFSEVASVPVGGLLRGIDVSADDSQIAVGGFGANALGVIDATTLAVTTTPLASAYATAYTPDGTELYVAQFSSSQVSVLNPSDLSTTTTIASISGGPRQIAMAPSGARAYVTSNNGAMTVISREVAPTITNTVPLPGGTQGAPFAAQVNATGWPAPAFSVTAGALPAGLTLDPATGEISGTPTTTGDFSFTITAQNSVGSTSRPFTISVAAGSGVAELAATGADALPWAMAALLVMGLGAALRLTQRRVNAGASRPC